MHQDEIRKALNGAAAREPIARSIEGIMEIFLKYAVSDAEIIAARGQYGALGKRLDSMLPDRIKRYNKVKAIFDEIVGGGSA